MLLKPVVRWLLMIRNKVYAEQCLRHSAMVCGEAPYASHVLFARALNDRAALERHTGMHIGFQWGAEAEARVVYCDYGISPGMREGIVRRSRHQALEYRYLFEHRARRCARCGVCIAPDAKECGRGACLVASVEVHS
jgi:hypothetical protein